MAMTVRGFMQGLGVGLQQAAPLIMQGTRMQLEQEARERQYALQLDQNRRAEEAHAQDMALGRQRQSILEEQRRQEAVDANIAEETEGDRVAQIKSEADLAKTRAEREAFKYELDKTFAEDERKANLSISQTQAQNMRDIIRAQKTIEDAKSNFDELIKTFKDPNLTPEERRKIMGEINTLKNDVRSAAIRLGDEVSDEYFNNILQTDTAMEITLIAGNFSIAEGLLKHPKIGNMDVQKLVLTNPHDLYSTLGGDSSGLSVDEIASMQRTVGASVEGLRDVYKGYIEDIQKSVKAIDKSEVEGLDFSSNQAFVNSLFAKGWIDQKGKRVSGEDGNKLLLLTKATDVSWFPDKSLFDMEKDDLTTLRLNAKHLAYSDNGKVYVDAFAVYEDNPIFESVLNQYPTVINDIYHYNQSAGVDIENPTNPTSEDSERYGLERN